jgi:hypothetical protein
MDGNQAEASSQPHGILARSAAAAATHEELVKYVFVELDVPRKSHELFQQRMPDLVELMFDHVRWELIFASYPLTGLVNRFIHIWRIPGAATLPDGMREGAVKLDAALVPKAGTLDEAFRTCYLKVQDLVARTSHTLMTSLPYDPTNVGFQSQTILIDAEGEAFIIDHKRLRDDAAQEEHPGLTDISRELGEIRRHHFTRLDRGLEKRPKRASTHAELVPSDHEAKKPLKEVQMHLNRGSAVARVKFGDEQALLFNLAGLKSKSVFQSVPPQKPEKAPALGALPLSGDGKVETPVKRLLIAMPWGGVYDLDARALERLAQPIPDDKQAATKRALSPIRAGFAPIAAIPAERDDIIGDDCACFVINLMSFVTTSGRARLAAET